MGHGEHHGPCRHGRPGDPGRSQVHLHHGAQTFRRGRALDFLQRLDVKRTTLAQQLEQPELRSIHQVLSGELKAIELVRNEFIELFDLHETRPLEDEPPTEAASDVPKDLSEYKPRDGNDGAPEGELNHP